MQVRVLHLDAFSARPGMGNPAGVLLDGERLTEAAKQAVARAVGFNETAFVLPSARADLRLRYFTPGHEVDLCGHATVGSFVALHQRDVLPGAGFPKRLTVETGAGLLPITVDVGEAGEPIVIMAQAPARFEAFGGSRAPLARVLGLEEDDLHPDLPILYGSTGLWTLESRLKDPRLGTSTRRSQTFATCLTPHSLVSRRIHRGPRPSPGTAPASPGSLRN